MWDMIPTDGMEIFEHMKQMLCGQLPCVIKVVKYVKGVASATSTVGKGIVGIQEKIYWSKFYRLLDNESLTETQRNLFLRKLGAERNKENNALRIIQIIDRAQSMKKIDYIINVTRNYVIDKIDIETFFRCCNMITETLEEDLIFLEQNINAEEEFLYSNSVQGLVNSGLMYHSVIDANGEQKFSFLPMAKILYEYALTQEESHYDI